MRLSIVVSLILMTCIPLPRALAADWVLVNPSKTAYENELVRVGEPIPADADASRLTVLQSGKPVPFDAWESEGVRRAFVMADVGAKQSFTYQIKPGTPAKSTGKIKIEKAADEIVLSNGLVSIRVPTGKAFAPPIMSVKIKDGPWVGKSVLETSAAFKSLEVTLGTGSVVGQAKLVYTFDTGTYTCNLTLPPDRPFVIVEESFDKMPAGSRWVFDVAAGWSPRNARVQLNNEGMGAGADNSFPKDKWPTTLATGQTRMGDRLVNLLPRWSQSFDDGWFFATFDNQRLIGALPARAGKWVWPHDNKIVVRVKESGDYAGLEMSVESGARYWLLLAGDAELGGQARDLAVRHTMANLDKIANDYVCTWPGVTKGEFTPVFFFDNATNPTGQRRQQGKAALKDAGKPGDLSTLFAAQQNMDPDWYGSYRTYWSPQNPNFYTDFHKVTIGLVSRLKSHPQFERFRARAEAIVREDLDHSVTLPGGAGQECPGYQHHAAEQWIAIADVCKQHLKFDPRIWPRFEATGSFIAHTSYPTAPGQRAFHPGGDTHPGRPDPIETAKKFGYAADVKSFVTEELPGFGVVFRSKSGTPDETYLAFKSGPNRGHYHGDQLSFHYCSNAKPLAVDHHCSYKPRAGQEHMHNRLAFSTDAMPHANMDGYERLIAFKPGKDVDIAMGQVQSGRLRAMTEFPPEVWDAREPVQAFDKQLTYRRTIVMVKDSAGDYFVIRDQYWGPSVNIHYMLHVLGDTVQHEDRWIKCDGLSLFVASPKQFDFKPFPWQHENGGLEKTTGPRLTVKGEQAEFVTAIFPGRVRDDVSAVENGAKVGDTTITFPNTIGPVSSNQQGQTHEEVRIERDGKAVASLNSFEVDFNRSQGDIGLFVPDAGYPFGPIPQWLREQRPARE